MLAGYSQFDHIFCKLYPLHSIHIAGDTRYCISNISAQKHSFPVALSFQGISFLWIFRANEDMVFSYGHTVVQKLVIVDYLVHLNPHRLELVRHGWSFHVFPWKTPQLMQSFPKMLSSQFIIFITTLRDTKHISHHTLFEKKTFAQRQFKSGLANVKRLHPFDEIVFQIQHRVLSLGFIYSFCTKPINHKMYSSPLARKTDYHFLFYVFCSSPIAR